MIRWIVLPLLGTILLSCKKEVIVSTGNKISPDPTVAELTIQQYVNKVYISLIGRKPDSLEFVREVQKLKAANFSPESRKTLCNQLQQTDAYFWNLFATIRKNYLGDIDTASIRQKKQQYLTNIQQSPQDSLRYLEAYQKMVNLESIPSLLKAKTIQMPEAHRRAVDNEFYDELNMGTENFVVSCFQNFLFRYPTEVELTNAKAIVDGNINQLFFQIGRSKKEFMQIFFASNDYYEGQVIQLYRQYLFRYPTSTELSQYAVQYKTTQDFPALQKIILTSTEYAFQ
ncbi:MAG: hypothetical protein NZ108_02710 [Bacteroidia bacterium]|nr:hypothetical protein [Bacteroidia bacterium]